MTHRLKVTISNYDGLMAVPVCEGHDESECGVREVFFWDSAAALENYQGEGEKVLADFPIKVNEISDDGIFWEDLPESEGKT